MAKPKGTKKAAPKEPEPPASSKKGKNSKAPDTSSSSTEQPQKGPNGKFKRPPMNPEARRAVTNSVSWTGKLPATLLHEHCQKQKWEKLQFDMKGGPDKGFVAIAVLAKKNVKTGQVETVRMMPPSDIFPLQKTPLEARHIAATYGLHRVASHRNMKPMLPPDHRDYWSKLDDLKKQHLAESSPKKGKENATNTSFNKDDKTYLYSEDPFQADRERKAQMEKSKEFHSSDEHKKKVEMRNIMSSVKTALLTESNASSSEDLSKQDNADAVQPTQSATNFKYPRPKFDKWIYMSKESRTQAEELIKKYHGFASSKKLTLSNWDISNKHYKAIVYALLQIGFSRYHAEESLEYCSTLSSAIEWLLIHVPEDDLPTIFAPSPEKMDNKSTKIVSSDLKKETIFKSIRTSTGYSEELIREHLDAVSYNKRQAIVNLTHDLISAKARQDPESLETTTTFWEEEMQSLECVYDPAEFSFDEKQHSCMFKYTIPVIFDDNSEYQDPENEAKKGRGKKNKAVYKVELSVWMSDNYPSSIPGMTINAQCNLKDRPKLPMYNSLDLIKRAGLFLEETASGDYMISTLSEWFKDNFANVLTNPSKLVELASGITGVEEEQVAKKVLGEKSKRAKRAKGRVSVGNSLDAAAMQQSRQTHLETSSNLKDMIKFRQTLPAWKKQKEIVDLVSKNQVVLITGETGSGKSTQTAQFLLDTLIEAGKGNTLNIVCSQPRRISAMGLAQRVADERDSPVGQEVGYVIRGESKTTKNTLLKFVTTGVLLRMIQSSSMDDSSEGSALQSVSHIIVDEVHERSLDSDFLLILLKRIASTRKDIKIILMSATVDPALFINYFGGQNKVGYTHIEGRTFPVSDFYLDKIVDMIGYVPAAARNKKGRYNEDDDDYGSDDNGKPVKEMGVGEKILAIAKQGIPYDLIASLVGYVDRELGAKDGSILIFMPGTAEIDRCLNTLKSSSSGHRYHALPLHASLAPAEQRKVFPAAPKHLRKVVVSTNVAETSITIPDIVTVIDTGRVKETQYDVVSNVTRLVNSWTSKASATQRRGRAGRVREGDCYKLFTKSVEEKDMPSRPLPEILRVPLEQLYLSVKAMGIKKPARFLHEAIDPPHVSAIERARSSLIQLGALETGPGEGSEEELTPLGTHMSLVPADLRVAKLLVLSAMFGCINTGLVVASILSLKSPFVSSSEQREAMREKAVEFAGPGATRQKGSVGDLLTQAKAYYEWEVKRNGETRTAELRRWCKDHFLSYQTLQDIQSAKRQFISTLQEIGFVPSGSVQRVPEHYTVNDDLANLRHTGVVRAVIGSAMGPTNLVKVVMPEKTFKTVGGAGSIEVELKDSRGVRYYGPKTDIEVGNNNTNNPHPPLTERFFVHPASFLFETTKFLDDTLSVDGHLTGYNDGAFLSFSRKMHTSKLFIDGLTPLNTYGLVFFADDLKVDVFGQGIVVGTGSEEGWLGVKCWPRIGILVRLLRQLFNELMKQKLQDPGLDLSKNEVILFIERLIETNGAVGR